MAFDKVVDSAALDASLTGIADAIRAKAGTTEPIALDAMAAAIEAIQSGGGNNLVAGTITPADDSNIVIEHNFGVIPDWPY